MANASHKHAGSYLSVESSLWAAELISLGESVATELFKRDDRPGPIVITDKTDSQLNFAVIVRKRTILRFKVNVSSAEDNHSVLRSQITAFVTEQRKILMLIPNEEKRLVGWNFYNTFMETLGSVIEARDPQAKILLQLEAG